MPDELEPQDVTPEPSPGELEPSPPAPSAVKEDVVDERGVPLKNRIAELQRKLAQSESRQLELERQVQSAAPKPVEKTYTTDELWELAKDYPEARQLLTDRLAQEAATRASMATRWEQHQVELEQERQDLLATYPEMADDSTPIAQAAHQEFKKMLSLGYPDTLEHRLIAAQRTIAKRPGLVTKVVTKPNEIGERTRRKAIEGLEAVGGVESGGGPKAEPKSDVKLTEADNRVRRHFGITPEKLLKRKELLIKQGKLSEE